jgi:hypothetical protein
MLCMLHKNLINVINRGAEPEVFTRSYGVHPCSTGDVTKLDYLVAEDEYSAPSRNVSHFIACQQPPVWRHTHILCDYEAIAYLTSRHMGHYFLKPSDYHNVPIRKVLRFIWSVRKS